MAAAKKLIDSVYAAAINCKHGDCWWAGKCEHPTSSECGVSYYRKRNAGK